MNNPIKFMIKAVADDMGEYCNIRHGTSTPNKILPDLYNMLKTKTGLNPSYKFIVEPIP
jgi:hypothetical protein